MTKHTYHPVGLAILRGNLVQAGFAVQRIRCISNASEDQSWAAYKVTVEAQPGADKFKWSPDGVRAAANGAFSTDVIVTTVSFIKDQWVVGLFVELGEEPRPHLPGMGDDNGE